MLINYRRALQDVRVALKRGQHVQCVCLRFLFQHSNNYGLGHY